MRKMFKITSPVGCKIRTVVGYWQGGKEIMGVRRINTCEMLAIEEKLKSGGIKAQILWAVGNCEFVNHNAFVLFRKHTVYKLSPILAFFFQFLFILLENVMNHILCFSR